MSASAALAPLPALGAEELVVRLSLPQRDASVETFAWREGNEYAAPRGALEAIGITPPDAGPRTRLADIPGLSFVVDEQAATIILTCTSACFETQPLDFGAADDPALPSQDAGAYVNYDASVQAVEDTHLAAAAALEMRVFSSAGLLEGSWLAEAEGGNASLSRLETRWTQDFPRNQTRVRIGDSVATGADGAPLRFAGVQVGRYFGLTPSAITYPTPVLEGDAALASTAELYVDGVLQGGRALAAGPFEVRDTPFVSGAGTAQLLVTDILGREQVITRPFFVSASMLRPGLSDWSVAAGVTRANVIDETYDHTFASARYRRGVTDWLTLEGVAEHEGSAERVGFGASITNWRLGQLSMLRTLGADGDATELTWLRNSARWSAGLSYREQPLNYGEDDATPRVAASGNLAFDLSQYGGIAVTAAQLRFDERTPASVYTLSYAPDFGVNRLSFGLAYAAQGDREDEVSARIELSVPLSDRYSARGAIDHGPDGQLYRTTLQRSADNGEGLSWRARLTGGVVERVDLGASLRGRLGDTTAQATLAGPLRGLRLGHRGSFGTISGQKFAGPTIEGAFALVEVDAANVDVTRNHFRIGATNTRGVVVATALQPYATNTISIDPDDLPFDRAPAKGDVQVTPREGAGVVVRFAAQAQQVTDLKAMLADGAVLPTGSILIRERDGARFPVGSNGRVSLIGALMGDTLTFSSGACTVMETLGRLTLKCAP